MRTQGIVKLASEFLHIFIWHSDYAGSFREHHVFCFTNSILEIFWSAHTFTSQTDAYSKKTKEAHLSLVSLFSTG